MGKGQSKEGANPVQGTHFSSKSQEDVGAASSNVDSGKVSPETVESTVEKVVCKVDELSDGEMREVEIGDAKILLVKDQGSYYAVGNKCTHYGAPLSKGAYCQGRVRCPWHGASFSVKTGDIEDFPGLDSLPVFQVETRGNDVIVRAETESLKKNKRIKTMSCADSSNSKTFVLVGGGAASATCAETLRQEGFTGRIVLLTTENSLPFDRPKLSKAMTTTAEAISLRNSDFYSDYNIEVLTGTEVTSVDTDQRQVETSSGKSFHYDALLLATGGRPRNVSVPGHDLNKVCVLRTPQDANLIGANCQNKHVVIIGTSFIGLEVAAYMHNKAASVSVVGQSKVALQRVFGTQIGTCITKLHEDKGIKFYFERNIQEFVGEEGELKQVVLNDGTALQADLCVLGVGVVPATDFLKDSGIALTSRQFVTVDKYMKTNVDGVFAAGDIVQFPLFLNNDQHTNIQHWQMAHQHGRIAGLNMLGKEVPIHSVPYFWTTMYGKSIRYTGYGAEHDDIIIHGDMTVPQFAAFFTKEDKVVAVASLASDPIVSQAASLMEQGKTIAKSEIIEDPKSWIGHLKD